VSWFQPWARKPINLARSLALAARAAGGRGDAGPGGAGGGGGGSDPGRYSLGWVDRTALPEALVTVVPALPLATLALAAPAPHLNSQVGRAYCLEASPNASKCTPASPARPCPLSL
jgi:hypothetical protein